MKDVTTTAFLLAVITMSAAVLISFLADGRINRRYGGKPILRSESPLHFWSGYAMLVASFSFVIVMCLRALAKIWGMAD